ATTNSSTLNAVLDTQITIVNGTVTQTQVTSQTPTDVAAAENSVRSLISTLGLAQYTNVGAGVGIAIIDSGFRATREFDTRITAFYDFTGGYGPVATAPSDGFGHGTHVAALAAANGVFSGGWLRGVAPGARLIGLKVLGDDGSGQTSDVISAIEFAILN